MSILMEWYHYLLIGIAVLFVFLIVISYFQAKGSSIKISEEEFKKNMRKGQLIDVRSKQEFESGHINGARNIPVSLIAREYRKVRPDQPVYLYCATGKRCSRAAVYLRAKGYTEIYQLDQGLKAWTGPLK